MFPLRYTRTHTCASVSSLLFYDCFFFGFYFIYFHATAPHAQQWQNLPFVSFLYSERNLTVNRYGGVASATTTVVIIIDRLWQQFVDCCFRGSSSYALVYYVKYHNIKWRALITIIIIIINNIKL